MSPRLVFCLATAVLTVIIAADSTKTGNESVILVPNQGNWSDANRYCQNNYSGELVSVEEIITCSSLPTSFPTFNISLWSGGYKIPAWIKNEGCYMVGNNMTQIPSSSLEQCVSKCKTRHVGFKSEAGRCMCFESMSTLTKSQSTSSCTLCSAIECTSILVYTVTDIYVDIDISDQSCVALYLNCKELYPVIVPEKCSSFHRIICENGFSDQRFSYKIDNQPQAELTCAENNDVLVTDLNKTCKVYNGSTAWTSIKLFWIDPVISDQGQNNKHNINNCSYTFCATKRSTSIRESGNCSVILDGYACKTMHPLPGQTETANENVLQFTMGITRPLSFKTKSSLDYKFEVTLQTTGDHISSPFYTTSIATSTQRRTTVILNNSTPEKSKTVGTTIGIVVSVVLVAAVIITIVLFLRRRSKRKSTNHESNSTVSEINSKHITSENYESPWDSEGSKTNSLVLQSVLSMSANGPVSKHIKRPDIALTTYAVVNKAGKAETAFQIQEPTAAFQVQDTTTNSDNTIKNETKPGDPPEDEYDKLDRFSYPEKIETLSDNVYDSTSGSRDNDDVTYNSMDHGGSWKEGKAATTLDHYS